MSNFDKLLIVIILINVFRCTINNEDESKKHVEFDGVKWKEIFGDEKTVINMLEKLERTHKMKATKKSHTDKKKGVDILLNGTVEDFRMMTHKNLMKIITNLPVFSLSLQKQLIIWEIFKNKRPVNQLTLQDLQNIVDLIFNVPEDDFYNINISDPNIMSFFGSHEKLSRRRAAILMYALKNRMNMEVFSMSIEMVARIKGLLCGFPRYDLLQMKHDVLNDSDKEVLHNLWACTQDQLQALLEVMQRSHIYANLEMWNETILNKMGFLLSILPEEDYKRIQPQIFSNVSEKVLSRFTREQIKYLSEEQVAHLNPDCTTVYNAKFMKNKK